MYDNAWIRYRKLESLLLYPSSRLFFNALSCELLWIALGYTTGKACCPSNKMDHQIISFISLVVPISGPLAIQHRTSCQPLSCRLASRKCDTPYHNTYWTVEDWIHSWHLTKSSLDNLLQWQYFDIPYTLDTLYGQNDLLPLDPYSSHHTVDCQLSTNLKGSMT